MREEGYEPKKLAPLRILEILERYSDCRHPMTQQEIADRLDRDYGIVLERKAVARNLRLLDDAGFELGSDDGRRGVYLAARRFEEGELRMLIDSVVFSRHIPQNYINELVEKLRSCGSRYFGRTCRLVQSADMLYRSQTKDIFYLIELLDDAMANERQVRFVYNEYGADKQLHPLWQQPRNVNPYRLVASNDHYFLVANIDDYDNLANFRLDKITQIAYTDRPRKNIRETASGAIRIGAYLTAHPFMLTGEPVHVVARIARDRIELAIDAFGDNFTLTDGGEELTLSVSVSEEDAYVWALQNGDVVEILEPQSLRDRIRMAVGKMRRKYLKTDADAYGEAVASARRNGDLRLIGFPVRARIGRESFPRIWRLEIVRTDADELSFVTKCPDLRVFIASACPASDYSPLARLPALKKVDIRACTLTSLAFLRGMKLSELVLADDLVEDLAPLYELGGLEWFMTGRETARRLDLARLRAAYPGIHICVDDDLERRPD